MSPTTDKSKRLFQEAQRYIAGGVNSPVRAFRGVGGEPLFIQRARGSRITDADGNEYIDYVGTWGPAILGHAHPQVIQAIQKATEKGTSFGAPTELETRLARLVCEAIPSIELVRFVNSGTEATMSALRAARAYTGRDKIIKFEGCYHGHVDSLLAKAGSGATTLGVPDSAGVPQGHTQDTLLALYNDLERVRLLFRTYSESVAAVIIEPVAANMGVVPPANGFLEGLREITQAYGALLIFDEVITGFRVAYGGAQERYGVRPDLTCLGKIVGGGLPVGAYGGKAEIMETVAPLGPVYQAGTLAGNPLAMTAGIETLSWLKDRNLYEDLEKKSAILSRGLQEAAEPAEIPVKLNRVGSIMTLFFNDAQVNDYARASRSDTELYGRYFHEMLREGLYLAPSQFEAMFISAAHTREDLEQTIDAARGAFARLTAENSG